MTRPGATAPSGRFGRFRHRRPVLSFLGAVAVVALPLLALEASGALDPRLEPAVVQARSAQRAAVYVELANDAVLAVDVEEVEVVTPYPGAADVGLLPPSVSFASLSSSPGLTSSEQGVPFGLGADIDAVPPTSPMEEFRLRAGATRVIVVRTTGLTPGPGVDALRIQVRTPVGVRRTITVDARGSCVREAC